MAGRPVLGRAVVHDAQDLRGLRDAHVHAGSAAALEVLTKLADWTAAATAPMTDRADQHMLGTEHGGMNEVLADVSALTGDPKYLTLARRFSHEALLTPLSDGRDTLDGLHANTQIPKVVGFQRLFELTGEDAIGARRGSSGRRSSTGARSPRAATATASTSSRRRLREASAVGEDDGDVLHAQHAAADRACCSRTIRPPRTPTTTSARCTTASSPRRIRRAE